MNSDILLDLRGLTCPVPLLKTQIQLRKMDIGEELTVLVTDPQAYEDFKALSSANAIALLEVTQHDSYLQIRMERT
jgi:tRNA 2-thiouridine synthesizing protein A